MFLNATVADVKDQQVSISGEVLNITTRQPFKQVSVGAIVKRIAVKGQFTFAYNNQAVPADSLVSMNHFHGTIFSFSVITLGDIFEIKETSGYIRLVINSA